MVAKGIWSKGKLIGEIRCFNGGVMTELKRNETDQIVWIQRNEFQSMWEDFAMMKTMPNL